MMHKYLILYVIFSILLLAVTLPSDGTAAATAQDARQFVDNLSKQVLTVLDSNANQEQRHQQLQQMFLENMDIDWMGRFALGPGWRQATGDQHRRYLDAYKHYLLARYTTNFTDYTGSNYNITGTQTTPDGQFTVTMHIKTPNRQQVHDAGYTLHTVKDGQLKITDIIVDGVSMITTQRADFSSVFQQQGINGLIAAIQNKMRAEKNGG